MNILELTKSDFKKHFLPQLVECRKKSNKKKDKDLSQFNFDSVEINNRLIKPYILITYEYFGADDIWVRMFPTFCQDEINWMKREDKDVICLDEFVFEINKPRITSHQILDYHWDNFVDFKEQLSKFEKQIINKK